MFVLSLSLAILALYSVSASDVLVLVKLDLHRLAIKNFSVLRGAQYSFGGAVDPTYLK